MNNKVLTIIAVTLAAVVLMAYLFARSAEPDSSEFNTNPAGNGTNVEEQVETNQDESVDRVVEIDARNYEYSIEQIQAAPGETIKVVLNIENGQHDFVIDELDVSTAATSAGETVSVTFTVPEDASGTYVFYCSVSNHRELGMEGELVVSQL